MGAQWAVDSTQWAVFLTFLFVKLECCNFVCSLEFGFHKYFCKSFLKILITKGVHWCTVDCKQCTAGCFSNFVACEAREL